MPRLIFAIFEGGGAKGIAHVGALAACEEQHFYFVGVAGAAVGAIMATLIAAGFSAKDLLNLKRPEDSILALYVETPLSLLGEAEWDEGKAFLGRAELALAEKGEKRRWLARWWLWRQKERLQNLPGDPARVRLLNLCQCPLLARLRPSAASRIVVARYGGT